MAILKNDEIEVGARSDGRAVLRLPIDGRKRQIVVEPDAALRVGSQLANIGIDNIVSDPRFKRVREIRLKPFDEQGTAQIALFVEDFGGPLVFSIGAKELNALATSATAALELSDRLGRA